MFAMPRNICLRPLIMNKNRTLRVINVYNLFLTKMLSIDPQELHTTFYLVFKRFYHQILIELAVILQVRFSLKDNCTYDITIFNIGSHFVTDRLNGLKRSCSHHTAKLAAIRIFQTYSQTNSLMYL